MSVLGLKTVKWSSATCLVVEQSTSAVLSLARHDTVVGWRCLGEDVMVLVKIECLMVVVAEFH